ncbi:hypothetical protein FHS29_005026 [Saccharothrix tamanrassetensis]|uniref:Uncharacterized protein n=1 Tax=Saccharothrix tamanrassetensis TaxID=1051531 RepID=A0A841CQK8_9PSEU|nr:hypothetical protein [Saccharothrix tamanrassetensis]MBB5958418.1 hypothetical protein [Saccharothrix tamanrassetensis]
MSAVPMLLVVLGAVVALVVVVVVVWKLLLAAGLLGLAQWAVVTQTDDPTLVVLVLGVPSLITVVAVSRLVSRPSAGLRRGRSRLKGVVLR